MKFKFIKKYFIGLSLIALGSLSFIACSGTNKKKSNTTETAKDSLKVIKVDPANFVTDGVTVTIVPCTLSNGTKTDCYQIVANSIPSDHQVGPWCPTNISDDATAGGIWLENGEVYDVDGEFIKDLATFYDDSTWLMYDNQGDIFVTNSLEDCENAANPNVGEEYKNFCVECLPSYITEVSPSFLIPVTPILQETPILFSSGPRGPKPSEEADGHQPPERPRNGERPEHPDRPEHPRGNNIPSSRGVALNGIEFSAPAPTDNILSAYTLAPFDDAGGHINVHQGYHYHAATGFSTKIKQEDGHAALIGYALDGIGIYELKDINGNEASGLDKLRGHSDNTRGYHYHVDKAGSNNFINGLKGAYPN